MEGVLVPEIWIEFAKKTGIKELRLTTRDIPDYDVLMKRRLKILSENKLKLKDIQRVIAKIRPLPGARAFLDRLREERQVLILSDTFYEFAMPLIKQLGYPVLWCNWLEVNKKNEITGYRLRQPNGKEKAVRAIQSAGFKVSAAGDSYNDVLMLKAADKGIFFNPPPAIAKHFSQFKVVKDYKNLLNALI